MSATLKAESILTDRYQTTVPETVRRALQLRKRDKIKYIIRTGGEVVLMRATTGDHDDPVLNQLLDFLAQDIVANPERLQAISDSLAHRLKSLVGSIDVDLNAPQSENDE
jgi:antitoxin PrlF